LHFRGGKEKRFIGFGEKGIGKGITRRNRSKRREAEKRVRRAYAEDVVKEILMGRGN